MRGKPKTQRRERPETKPGFDLRTFLSAGTYKKHIAFRKNQILFTQGDPAKGIFYLQEGSVRLTVTSSAGQEAVVTILGPGDFVGETCLLEHPVWMATATAMTAGNAIAIEKKEMLRLLHVEHEFSDHFISYLVSRNQQTEEDLVDHLFNPSEKRLARVLLRLAHYGKASQCLTLPKVTQTLLAEMVGTSRTRINYFMNKFRKLGFIEYSDTLKIHPSLLSVLLRDQLQESRNA